MVATKGVGRGPERRPSGFVIYIVFLNTHTYSRVNISTVHLDLLRTIHKSTCIADLYSRQSPAYELKTPLKKQGAMDRPFLLDTVRHISRHHELLPQIPTIFHPLLQV